MVGKIIFKISADGETEIRVEGASGTSCTDLTRPFEEALGTIQERKLTDEYYEQQDNTNVEDNA